MLHWIGNVNNAFNISEKSEVQANSFSQKNHVYYRDNMGMLLIEFLLRSDNKL